MRIRIIILTICFIGKGALAAGQVSLTPLSPNGWAEPLRGVPSITTFDVPPSRANGEVWAFSPANAGQLWVGSDELFLFDGNSRVKIDLPPETYGVRTLAPDRFGTLWVGAIGEIGHLEQTTNGSWRYISAKPELQAAGINDLHDVWSAHQTPDGMVFVLDEQFLRWNGSRFERWKLPASPRLLVSKDRETLWIYQSGTGLLQMAANGPVVSVADSELPDKPVICAVSPGSAGPAPQDNQLLIVAPNGVYLRRSGGWTKLENLSAAVSGNLAWQGVLLSEDTVAIGTMSGGVVIGTARDEVLATINRSSGLPNETVTSLWYDSVTGNLWIGLVGGMARVEARGAASVFDAHNGLNYTPIQKTVSHNGQTYILSRQSLSVLSPGKRGRPATANSIVRLPAPNSDLLSSGPDLWLSGLGGGLWRILAGREKQEVAASGYIFALAKAQWSPFTLFLLENSSVRALAPRHDGGWAVQDLAADVGAYTLSLVQDEKGDVWVSTATHGIFCFRPDDNAMKPQLRLIHHYARNQGFPVNIKRPMLTTLGGRVYVLSEEAILGLSLDESTFAPVPGLKSFAALAGTPADDPEVAYWVVRNLTTTSAAASKPALIKVRAGAADAPLVWEPLDAPWLEQAGRIYALNYSGEGGGALWAAGSQALVRLSVGVIKPQPQPPAVSLRSLTCNGVPVDLPKANDVLKLDPSTKNLRFEINGVRRAEGNGLLIQTALRGLSDEWSLAGVEPSVDFAGLRAGKYSFVARAVDSFGHAGPSLEIAFILPPPWYQTPPMIGCYILATLLAGLGLVWWRLRQLRKSNARLNRLVDERTQELVLANSARNEFLENISHEIRNPLNGITNLVDLLGDSPLRPEDRRLAQSLVRSTDHLKRVFNDVLSYTKLEYGHVNVSSTAFSLVEVLEDVVALLQPFADEQKVDLSLRLSEMPVDGFKGDEEKIRTIVTNFVGNALKYAPGGTVIITAAAVYPASGDKPLVIRVSVNDNGPGIAQDEQAHLFRKFVRGAQAKASGVSGTGLGLAMCRSLADLMDGQVGVTSTLGQGATFWLEVPLQSAPLPKADDKADDRIFPLVPSDRLRALIVDDQEYNRVVLLGIVRRLGFKAEVASWADEVWPLVERYQFQVVFLDWELPGLTGGEIARQLRRHANARDAIIIATTAHEADDIRQACLESGMDGFAAKPFDTAQVKSVLSLCSARRFGRHSAPRTEPVRDQRVNAESGKLTLSAFSDFAEGDPNRARQAVGLYLSTLDQELQALQHAISSDVREEVARRAHRLRSHAGLVNGVGLNAAANKLVRAARSHPPADWRSMVPAVFAEGESLKAAINAFQLSSSADA